MMSDEKRFELNLMRMSPDRREVLERFTGGQPTAEASRVLTRMLTALRDTVVSRRRTELRGFGVFFWKPWSNRLPTGRRTDSWRLIFKFSQRRRYNGDN